MRKFVLVMTLLMSTFTIVHASSWSKHLEGLLKNGVKAIPWAGPALKDFFFGSDVEAVLGVQRGILQTQRERQSTLKTAVQQLLSLKKTIEHWDLLRLEGIRVACTLKKMRYTSALMSLTQDALEISLDPSHYIPSTPYTRNLKKSLRMSLGEDRGSLTRAEHFVKRTRKALTDLEPRPYTQWQEELKEANAREQRFSAFAARRKVALARQCERQAKVLLESNAALQNLLEDSTEQMTLHQRLHTYHLLHENVRQAGALKTKATHLLEESIQLRPEEQAALEDAEQRAFVSALIDHELERR